jgi:hypothetical protein
MPPKRHSMQGMDPTYASYARTQALAAKALLPLFTTAVADAIASLPAGRTTLHATEIGSADGINSDDFVGILLKQCGAAGLRTVVLSLLDLPGSNWNALAKRVLAWKEAAATAGISLRTRFLPASMYEPFTEAATEDVVFSSTSLHWASRSAGAVAPGAVYTHPFYFMAQPSAATAAWRSLAAADTARILDCIAAALRVGGAFVASIPTHTTTAGDASDGNSDSCAEPLECWWKAPLADLTVALAAAAAEAQGGTGGSSAAALPTSTAVLPTHCVAPETWAAAATASGDWALPVAPFEVVRIPDEYAAHAVSASAYGAAYAASVRSVAASVLVPPVVSDPAFAYEAIERCAASRFEAAQTAGARPPGFMDGVSVLVRLTRL